MKRDIILALLCTPFAIAGFAVLYALLLILSEL